MAGLLLALVFEIYANDGDPMAPGSATLIGCVVGFLGGLAVISNTRDMTALIVTAPLWVAGALACFGRVLTQLGMEFGFVPVFVPAGTLAGWLGFRLLVRWYRP